MKLKWISPGLPENLEQCEDQIRREIDELDMDDPMDLYFHTVFPGESMDGPCITVTPSDDRQCLECWYDHSPEWSEMGPIEEGPLAGKTVVYLEPTKKDGKDD